MSRTFKNEHVGKGWKLLGRAARCQPQAALSTRINPSLREKHEKKADEADGTDTEMVSAAPPEKGPLHPWQQHPFPGCEVLF